MIKNIFLMLEKWVKFHLVTRTRDQEVLHAESRWLPNTFCLCQLRMYMFIQVSLAKFLITHCIINSAKAQINIITYRFLVYIPILGIYILLVCKATGNALKNSLVNCDSCPAAKFLCEDLGGSCPVHPTVMWPRFLAISLSCLTYCTSPRPCAVASPPPCLKIAQS